MAVAETSSRLARERTAGRRPLPINTGARPVFLGSGSVGVRSVAAAFHPGFPGEYGGALAWPSLGRAGQRERSAPRCWLGNMVSPAGGAEGTAARSRAVALPPSLLLLCPGPNAIAGGK